MPAVRDVSWAATTVATGTTLVIPIPEYAQNDLLLAIFMADTGTATWSSSGWTHVTGSPSTNTAQLVCMYKIAGASESDTTFTASAAESFNGCIMSIRDVNTTNPFGSTPVINFANQSSAAKFSMQTITTNVNNSLVIHAFANSAVGVPSILEGPVYGLIGADGVAESIGVGWGFQATAGTTPSSVGVSNVASGAGRKMVLQVVPPSGGATVIPAYCTADSSVYVNPINGVTAYNGDTALAATADTGFSTSLGGLTAADAAVAAATDAGINSFHSVGRVTSISGSKNLSGVELVLATANKPDVTGKNVLVHVGPSTEGQLQRFSSVASGRGIWFGMRSGAASNWKIWQVYGVEKGSLRHQPVVINEGAGNTKSTNGTLAANSIAAFGFWVSGTGVTTTVWDFASLWVLDTTTVAGGNSTEPLKLPGIVAAASTGKERRSLLLQGAKQALSYQPIQIGNGGTDPTYLDLDATAIEFPRQFNEATAEVTYNSTDNVAGITYHAGSSDTIKHRNSVISSASKYKWGVHASSSTSATYDFSGLSVIGAGTVTLKSGITFSGVVFSGCSEITASGATITGCSFKSTSGTNAVSVASATEMSTITNCTFSGNANAIKISTAGTYAFSGITMSGNTNDVNVTATTGTVTINVTGGGSVPSFTTAGATVVINNTKTLTIEIRDADGALITSACEVTVVKTSDTTVLYTVENVTTGSTQYAYNYTSNVDTYINVHNVSSYEPKTVSPVTLGNSDQTVVVQLDLERGKYSNP